MAVVSSQPVPISMHPWEPLGRYEAQPAPEASSSSAATTWANGNIRPLAQRFPSASGSRDHESTGLPRATMTPDYLDGAEASYRVPSPLHARSSLVNQQDARRGSDEQGNKKRPQSCDICRVRKVKCVLVEGMLPGQTKCKQCQANNVSCTYAYIPKRPGPQTSSAKSIARREEKERQAKAAAVAAAARSAGIRDKGKARRRGHFHEGTGSTPPSSNDASRKSSAVVSRHGSPSAMSLEFRQLGFHHPEGMPLMHHYQTGLYETPSYADPSSTGYNLDSTWSSGFTTDSYLSATSTPSFGAQTSTTTVTPSASGHRHGTTPQHQGSCLHSAHSRRNSGADGHPPSLNSLPSEHGPSRSNGGFPSLSRPVSPSLGNASWSGCLHESTPMTVTPDPLEALKSLSRPSSPRASMMLPAADFLHPLTEPLHSLSFASSPFAPQGVSMGHSHTHSSKIPASSAYPEGSQINASPDVSANEHDLSSQQQQHRVTFAPAPMQQAHIGAMNSVQGAPDAAVADPMAATSSLWQGARAQSMYLPNQWQQPAQHSGAPMGSMSSQRMSMPLPNGAHAPVSAAALAPSSVAPASTAPPTSMHMWNWNFPPLS